MVLDDFAEKGESKRLNGEIESDKKRVFRFGQVADSENETKLLLKNQLNAIEISS